MKDEEIRTTIETNFKLLALSMREASVRAGDMEKGLTQQKLAAASGYWPLIRYNPALRKAGNNPFVLDSPRPVIGLRDYAYNELRYKILTRTNPEEAETLMQLAQELVDLRWKTYEEMAGQGAQEFAPVM